MSMNRTEDAGSAQRELVRRTLNSGKIRIYCQIVIFSAENLVPWVSLI